ncbi:hypothetical protein E0Z10_g8114 [Xylaria hypoxylon]|uniref:Rhodopsin domain-containing protein n=1 Tax=Xylaria hypoxylon TaxID=37992 RepID=A0A4Z0YKL0_9PEZI|nr:hypothetical protein E0Z10_g8114 [Xylaria hypoxylon]
MSAPGAPDVISIMAASQGSALLAVSVTTMGIALLSCIMRYYVRSRTDQRIGSEDYFVGGAMFLGIVGVSLTIVESVSQGNPQSALQFDYLAQPWLSMSSALSKASIYLFLQRLISKLRFWRIAIGMQIAFLLLVNLAYVFTTLLQCRPLEKLWKPEISGYCWSLGIQQNIGYVQGAFDVFTQLFITLFPIMIMQDLEIPRNLRWPFYLLAITSIITAMIATLRTYNISLIQLNERQTFDVIKTIFAVLEQNLNIVSANILLISSLFSKNVRPVSPALDDALISRAISTGSISSKRSKSSRVERRLSKGSNVMVETIQRMSSEGSLTVDQGASAESWPQGIIKTVSVEVVEEDAVDIKRDSDRGGSRSGSRQTNWDAYLR